MANKKINQLVSKTSILSTDLFGIGDATTGQLFKKTIAELQAAIGGAVISVNGLVGTVVLDTDDIQELATPTNKYFTDARARAAISLTVTGNSGASTYSSGTGVLNVPTYTLAGLGGITASFLSGTSGISYNSTTGVISYSGTVYTDSSIRALLSGGTGISYNSTTGAISYSGTVYTDSSVRALISLTTTGSSGASTYNNTTGVINVPEYTLAGLGGISLTSLSGGTGITYNNTTGQISYSGTVYTDASVRALVSAGTGLSYNNTTGVFTSTITQYTDALARASISLTTTGSSGASTYNSTTGVLNVPNYGSALSGTTGYHAKFTSSTAIGNSLIYDTGTAIGIGTTTPGRLLDVSNTGAAYIRASDTTNSVNVDMLAASSGGWIGTQSSHAFILQTANTERMRITSGGFVGLGTSSPATQLSILSLTPSSSTLDAIFNITNDVDSNFRIFVTGSAASDKRTAIGATTNTALAFITNNTERMRITSDGKIGIGTTTPAQKLTVSDNTSTDLILQVRNLSNGYGTNLFLQGNNNDGAAYNSVISYTFGGTRHWGIGGGGSVGTCVIDTNGSERLRITSGGNLLLGTTSDNGERLYVSGSIRATGSITANSDISLKKNLLKIENALEKVEQINGYTYELKEDDSKRHGGVIAQEIDKVFPEIVNTGNNGLMGVEYGNISALLIEAIKEQNTKIKNLETLLASK